MVGWINENIGIIIVLAIMFGITYFIDKESSELDNHIKNKRKIDEERD